MKHSYVRGFLAASQQPACAHLLSVACLCALLQSPTTSLGIDAILTDDSYTSTTATTVDWGGAATISLSSTKSPWLKFDLLPLPTGTTGSQVAKATLTLFVSSVQSAGFF